MTTKRIFQTICLFIFALTSVFILTSSSQKMADSLWEWIPTLEESSLAQERMYIQTDKPLYKPGETIWFAAHLRATKDFAKNTPSEIVRVKIENPQGQSIFHHRLIVEEGIAAGEFQLGEDAVGGMYRIKAYTQWQLNETEPEVFTKELYVQTAVLPRLKMKLKFLREGVGPGDEVLAEIHLENNQNKPLAEQAFVYELTALGEKLLAGKAVTGQSGIGLIRFQLPADLKIEDVILQAKIPYQGIQESISRSVPVVLQQLDLRFFPEGGGIASHRWQKSRIAFKAMSSKSKAVDVAGVILDRKGNEVTTFESFHQGMGSMKMHVESDQQYFAKITEPAGIDMLYPLPGVDTEVSLNLKSNDGQVMYFDVISPGQAFGVQVAISVRGHEYYRDSYSLGMGKNGLRLFTEGLPMGIARVTLEDMEGNGLAERLIYVHYDKQAKIEIKTDKEKYLPREKVEVTVSAKNSLGKPIAADLSIAVTDDQLLSHADDHSSNLLSWMLVESELTGKIEKPEFYFDPKEEKAEQALDLLLLTHGWRRFVWREQHPTDSTKRYVAEQKEYRGLVVDGITRKPLLGLKARIGNTGPWTVFDSGEFRFANPENRPQMIFFQAEGYYSNHLLAPNYANDIEWAMHRDRSFYQVPDTGVTLRVTTPTFGRLDDLPPLPPVEEMTPPPPPLPVPAKRTDAISLPPKMRPIGFEIPEPPSIEENKQDLPLVRPEMTITEDDVEITDIEELVGIESVEEEPIDKNFMPRVEPDVNAFIFVSEEPQPLNMEEVRRRIGYPEIARDAGIEGQVVVRILVDERGNYMRHKMIKKVHPILSKSVEAALLLLKFTPAIQNNRPIKYWVNLPFRFKLLGNGSFASQPITLSSQVSFHQVREFAFPDYAQERSVTTKTDFRTTLYWNPHLQLGAKGMGSFSFYTSDAISSYRITAEGFGEPGIPARAEQLFYSQEPLQMDIRLPAALTQGDILKVPITLVNRYDYAVNGRISLDTSPHVNMLAAAPYCELNPGEAKTFFLPMKAMLTGKVALNVRFDSQLDHIESRHTLCVRERGFPVAWSHQEISHQGQVHFSIQDHIDSTLHLSWVGYPNVMTEILDGMEAMLREPHGCFEQTSSATYPNILVLQLLRNTHKTSPDLEQKALAFIQKGHKRLQGFEVAGGGFDWYGKGPAHEVLTAYGLMEFADMKTVWSGVNDAMVQRAVDWLRTRRDGEGGFTHQSQVFYTANQYDQLGKDLYVAYSLVEAGFSAGFDREIGHAIQQALEMPSPFLRAMAANILAKQENYSQAKIALQPLSGEAMVNEYAPLGMGGNSLVAGVYALRLMAMLEVPDFTPWELEAVAHQLRKCRTRYGHFGSTQSTVMALRALSKYEGKFSQNRTSLKGDLRVTINGEMVANRIFDLGEDSLIVRGMESHISMASSDIKVDIQGLERPITWSLRATYKARKPQDSEKQKLSLTLRQYSHELKMGSSCFIEAHLKNMTNRQQASAMARIGIPAGLSPQIWQLKEWIKEGRIAFYEWEKGYLTCYFYGMKPLQEIVLPLSLKADLPGSYTSLPSVSYLYYTPEFKSWIDPVEVEIMP